MVKEWWAGQRIAWVMISVIKWCKSGRRVVKEWSESGQILVSEMVGESGSSTCLDNGQAAASERFTTRVYNLNGRNAMVNE